MKFNTKSIAMIAAALGLMLGLGAVNGCAQNVGDINRVQPNYWKKSDFTGEWYIRQTIADVPPSVGFSFVGMTMDLEKVRWEITEGWLVAYRSYEKFPGMNPEVDQNGKSIGNTDIPRDADGNPIWDEGYYNKNGYKDAPIAAYPIKSHFDIQRQYNAATGEQTNVIVENSNDLPWYDREFMRVDWSQNKITNFTGDVTGSSGFDGAEYVQESEGGDYAFRMEDAEGQAVVMDPTNKAFATRSTPTYFDFTSRLYVPAPLYTFSDGYQVPACYLVGEHYDCTGGEVKVRTSVMKVGERNYAPKVYDDKDMLKFGYFRTERVTYDRRRGSTDEGQIFLANMHHIWVSDYDADGKILPYGMRTPQPTVYAISANWPKELQGAAEWVARGWSKALTRAVAAAQNKEVQDIFKQFPYEDDKGNYLNTGLFRVDYNEDGHARVGDLRYHFMYWVDQPQVSSPLGYGPSSVDPETGEIVTAQAYVYGAPIDTYAQFALDVVDALNGDIKIDDMIDGSYVKDSIAANRDRVDPRARARAMGLESLLDRPLPTGPGGLLNPQQATKLEAIKQFGLEPLKESSRSRMKRIENTPLESYMVNDEIRAVLAQKFNSPELMRGEFNEDLLKAARPLTLNMDKTQRDYDRRISWASRNNIMLADFQDPSILGLAKDLASSGKSREEMYQWLRSAILRGVTEHEVGHTMGLRHNFQGSYDSINYFDNYWQLRKENINKSPSTINDLITMGAPTQTQIDGKMREYQYSTIMDYGRGFNSDIHGLGKYDEAAILYAYSDSVEVFKQAGGAFKADFLGTPYEAPGSRAYDQWLEDYHYTEAPIKMGDGDIDLGVTRLSERLVVPWATVKSDREADNPDRLVEVPYMFCSDEWVAVDASCHRWDEGADMWEQTQNVIESWRDYYWFNNFRRNRYGWSPFSTYQRSVSRYLSLLPNFYQDWLFSNFSAQPDNTESLYKQIGMLEGYNFLLEILSMPAYGSYDFNAADNAYEYTGSYGHQSNEALYLERGNDARRSYTRYDYNRGYYYYNYPQEAGQFWDYYAALQALSQSSATVRGVDTQSDFSTYLIPYYLVFDTSLTRIYDGIVTQDYSAYAPRYTTVGSGKAVVQRPAEDYLGLYPDGSDFLVNDPVIKPDINFTNRFYALLFGMSSFTSSYSLNFPDDHKIFRLGSGESLEAGVGFDAIKFNDPDSGIVYGSLQKQGAEPTAATRLIQKANRQSQTLAACAVTDTTCQSNARNAMANTVEWLNIERAMYDVFGRTL